MRSIPGPLVSIASERSCPAQNAFPSPVNKTARIDLSDAALSKAA